MQSENQTDDPWATIVEAFVANVTYCDRSVSRRNAERLVDTARAEVERRHTEALADIKATHEATLAAAGRSHAQALKAKDAERDTLRSELDRLIRVFNERVNYIQELEGRIDTLRSKLKDREESNKALVGMLSEHAIRLDESSRNAFWICGVCEQWTTASDPALIIHESPCPLALKEPKA